MSEYRSQYRQDFLVDQILGRKENGFFLDIGAHNGITFSNSYFFEKARTWNGICVEPIKEVFLELKKNRTCHCENVAIFKETGKVKFQKVSGVGEMLSGIKSNLNDNHLEKFKKEMDEAGETVEVIECSSITIEDLQLKYDFEEIDYISIDIEGGEFDVITSIDFKKIKVSCLTIENNDDSDDRIKNYLIKSGYYFLFKYGVDEFYVLDPFKAMTNIINTEVYEIWLSSIVKGSRIKGKFLYLAKKYFGAAFVLRLGKLLR